MKNIYKLATIIFCCLMVVGCQPNTGTKRLYGAEKRDAQAESIYEGLRDAIERGNADLPEVIPGVGVMKRIDFVDDVISLYIDIEGDSALEKLYTQKYDMVKESVLFAFLMMNSHNDLGKMILSMIKKADLRLRYVTTIKPSGKEYSFVYSATDIREFLDRYKLHPTEALAAVIDMQVIEGQEFPAWVDDYGLPHHVTDDELPDVQKKYIVEFRPKREGTALVLSYSLPEIDESLADMADLPEDEAMQAAMAQDMASDPTSLRLINLLVMAHSDLIVRYTGARSGQTISMNLPYSLLRKYCTLPESVLSLPNFD